MADWERRELAKIERELRTDKALRELLAGTTKRQARWLATKRLAYPRAVWGAWFVYALTSLPGAWLVMLLCALAVCIGVSVAVEAVAGGRRSLVRHAAREFGAARRL
jgi:hypothetical protein